MHYSIQFSRAVSFCVVFMYLHFYTFPLHNLFQEFRYIVSYSTLFYSVICTKLIFTLFFIVTDSFLLCFTYVFSYFSFPLSLIDCDVLTLSISLDPFSSAHFPSALFFFCSTSFCLGLLCSILYRMLFLPYYILFEFFTHIIPGFLH